MESESSLALFVVVLLVEAFVRVVVVVLVVFGLFFSTAFLLSAAPAAAAAAVVVVLFVVVATLFAAAGSLVAVVVFFGCAADGFGSVVGDGDANVFFGGSIFFVDDVSNFRARSNESASNESRFAVDDLVTFFVGAVFLSSLVFDLPACSADVFS